jgi:hypothetical protein
MGPRRAAGCGSVPARPWGGASPTPLRCRGAPDDVPCTAQPFVRDRNVRSKKRNPSHVKPCTARAYAVGLRFAWGALAWNGHARLRARLGAAGAGGWTCVHALRRAYGETSLTARECGPRAPWRLARPPRGGGCATPSARPALPPFQRRFTYVFNPLGAPRGPTASRAAGLREPPRAGSAAPPAFQGAGTTLKGRHVRYSPTFRSPASS